MQSTRPLRSEAAANLALQIAPAVVATWMRPAPVRVRRAARRVWWRAIIGM